ncbi:beta-1,3-glucan-binding protein 1-like isoform X2 [Agrilus planipennis]|uniref:Beta-1,3-glucan-binding protein 1-like isoform X2 n=1 Tax=Agrilus planipennis TaxID=224129 RepID=A0A7F5R4M9_AGRPL|nr:beta-1,3-glucan-binding protein 1-like isoform X2 [Agrilus planipennis]
MKRKYSVITINVVVFIAWIFCVKGVTSFEVPPVKMEAFTPTGFRASILVLKPYEEITGFPNSDLLCEGTVIFEDTFKTKSLNQSVWQIEHRIPTYTGPDYEFNSYLNSEETIFIKNSTLFLRPVPHRDEADVRGDLDLRNGCTAGDKSPLECFYQQKSAFLLPLVKSARIYSKKSFKFGTVYIRCKLPAGDWIYPIVHLEPVNSNNNLPMIWIAFSRGNDRLYGAGGNDLGSRLLFGGPIFDHSEPGRSRFLRTVRSDTPFFKEFHTYKLVWKPDRITFGVDNYTYGTVQSNEFSAFSDMSSENNNLQFRLSIGVGVGGITNFPDGFKSGEVDKPWNNPERNMLVHFFNKRNEWLKTWTEDGSALQIDYVRIWTL